MARDVTIRPSETAAEAHRRAYPEQYAHPLVGKRVRCKDGTEGTVLRVFGTRFGLLAALDSLPATQAVAVATLDVQ